MLLKDSGRADATEQAIDKFETARKETPNDATLVHALAMMYDRRGVFMKVIELLEPLRRHPSPKTRKLVLQQLIRAYEQTMNIGEAAEAKRELAGLEQRP